jgi:hypothetical protein
MADTGLDCGAVATVALVSNQCDAVDGVNKLGGTVRRSVIYYLRPLNLLA